MISRDGTQQARRCEIVAARKQLNGNTSPRRPVRDLGMYHDFTQPGAVLSERVRQARGRAGIAMPERFYLGRGDPYHVRGVGIFGGIGNRVDLQSEPVRRTADTNGVLAAGERRAPASVVRCRVTV